MGFDIGIFSLLYLRDVLHVVVHSSPPSIRLRWSKLLLSISSE